MNVVVKTDEIFAPHTVLPSRRPLRAHDDDDGGAPMYAFSITNGLPALPLGRCLVMEYIVAMLAVLSWLSWSMPPSLQRPCVEDNPR